MGNLRPGFDISTSDSVGQTRRVHGKFQKTKPWLGFFQPHWAFHKRCGALDVRLWWLGWFLAVNPTLAKTILYHDWHDLMIPIMNIVVD